MGNLFGAAAIEAKVTHGSASWEWPEADLTNPGRHRSEPEQTAKPERSENTC